MSNPETDDLSGMAFDWGDKMWEGIDENLLERYFEAEETRGMINDPGVWRRAIPYERLDRIDANESLEAIGVVEKLIRGVMEQSPTGKIDEISLDAFLGCGTLMAKRLIREVASRGLLIGNIYEGYRLRKNSDKFSRHPGP